MKGPVALITLFSLLFFAGTIESRHEPGDSWRDVMKNEPDHLIHSASKPHTLEGQKDCHETLMPEEEKLFVKGVGPRPIATFYPNDAEAKESSTKEAYWGKVDPQKEKPFKEDFEPRPNLSVYNN